MKMLAEPRRYQGFMANEIMAQMKKPLRTVRYLGKRAAMSLPALRRYLSVSYLFGGREVVKRCLKCAVCWLAG